VLVGHSLSGRIISVVADRRPDLVSKLIYFDAAIPVSGERLSTLMPDYWQRKLETAITVDGTSCFAPSAPATMGISDPEQLAWVARRLSPVPARIVDDPVTLDHPIGNGTPRVFLRCTTPVHTLNAPMVERARALGFEIVDIAVGHDAMVTEPERLADILVAHAI
jgi:pimeloyl-ACP methyl ester carboxylesterase